MNLFEAYQLLHLDGDHSSDDPRAVEKAFRIQARKHHPDKGGQASHFQRLQRAKEVVLNRHQDPRELPTFVQQGAASVGEILHNGRTCIRQVISVSRHSDSSQRGGAATIVAATDDGMWWFQQTGGCCDYGKESTLTKLEGTKSFLCCASASTVHDSYIYAGGKDGLLFCLDLDTGKHTVWEIAPALVQSSIVSVAATPQKWVAIATANGTIQILKSSDVGSDSPPKVAWQTTNTLLYPDTLLLEVEKDCLYLWVGGSTKDGNGWLRLWELSVSNLEDQLVLAEKPKFFWEESDSDSDNDAQDEMNDTTPTIDLVVQEGPVYSLTKEGRRVVVVANYSIIVWECINHVTSKHRRLEHKRTLPNSDHQTLYSVALQEDWVVAGGSGECLFVWDMRTWDLVHIIPISNRLKGCCLATNCILALDWVKHETGVLVCGGYDGCVSLWRLAHRLGQ